MNPPKSQGLWDVVKYTVGIFQNAAFIEVHTFLTEIKYKLQFLFVKIRVIFIGCSFALIVIIKSSSIILKFNICLCVGLIKITLGNPILIIN